MTSYASEVLEEIRTKTDERTAPDDMLNFYVTAIEDFGLSPKDADEVDEVLTTRVMRARGAI